MLLGRSARLLDSAAGGANKDTTLRDLVRELHAHNANLARLEKSVAAIVQQAEASAGELGSLQRQIASTQSFSQTIDAQNKLLASAHDALESLVTRLADADDELAARVDSELARCEARWRMRHESILADLMRERETASELSAQLREKQRECDLARSSLEHAEAALRTLSNDVALMHAQLHARNDENARLRTQVDSLELARAEAASAAEARARELADASAAGRASAERAARLASELDSCQAELNRLNRDFAQRGELLAQAAGDAERERAALRAELAGAGRDAAAALALQTDRAERAALRVASLEADRMQLTQALAGLEARVLAAEASARPVAALDTLVGLARSLDRELQAIPTSIASSQLAVFRGYLAQWLDSMARAR